ncbi:MAG: hypothetical protein A2511_05785 [Deltaproteobacteria bacterium RIFOXYD12_FULL_50_9]|nr:MAG: hypothetical protein A2511_05785 [Deltaproteobacteria bacterium RIFOXYD12_FULL_50_9]
MKLTIWFEQPVSTKTIVPKILRDRRDFFQQVSSVFSHNETEFNGGTNREQRIVDPLMIELLP